jgi:hypothetical protein
VINSTAKIHYRLSPSILNYWNNSGRKMGEFGVLLSTSAINSSKPVGRGEKSAREKKSQWGAGKYSRSEGSQTVTILVQVRMREGKA